MTTNIDVRMALIEGARLSTIEAIVLQRAVGRHPNNIHARLKLIAHAYVKGRRFLRRHQVLWMIQHYPELCDSQLFVLSDSNGAATGAEHWLAHLAKGDLLPSGCAAGCRYFLSLPDLASAEKFAVRAVSLEPNNAHWRLQLGKVLVLRAQSARDAEIAKRFARRALDQLTTFEQPPHSVGAGSSLVAAAIVSQDPRYGERVLALLHRARQHHACDGCSFYREYLAGFVSLWNGDVDLAAQHLVTSASHVGGALATFGPPLDLAEALLLLGERTAAASFLRRCAPKWRAGTYRLHRWAREIENGESPRLERFSVPDPREAVLLLMRGLLPRTRRAVVRAIANGSR